MATTTTPKATPQNKAFPDTPHNPFEEEEEELEG